MPIPQILDLGTPELLIIFAVIVLLFGAAKLPDLARSSGRSLRIFKAETKGLLNDDDEKKTPEQLRLEAEAKLETEARLEAERREHPTD